jgi:L-iditol 2-dehydrogenase
MTIAALRAVNAARIFAIEPLAHRRELARNIGAHVALTPEEAITEIASATGKRGVDCALDCAAAEHTTTQAIQLVRNAGRVVLTGIPVAPSIALDVSLMRRKEITLFNVRRSNHETDQALDLLCEHSAWFAPVLTHTRPIDRIDDAFTIASNYQDGVGKMIVAP